MNTPLLSVVVVSYNTANLTTQTVNSIFFSLEKEKTSFLHTRDVEVIVVDNHSSDESVALLKKTFGSHIHVIVNMDNVGFARANNQGAKLAHGEYLLLLNSDTVIHPGALDALVNSLKNHPDIGIVAASLHNPDGSYQPQGGALPTLSRIGLWWLWPFPGVVPLVAPYQDIAAPADSSFWERGWVGGTATMMRLNEYVRLGGLDEKIFMYAEDVDLCMRVRDSGKSVGILPLAVVTHIGSASGSSLRARLGEVRGLLYLFGKHKPVWQTAVLRLILAGGSVLRFILFGILKMNKDARSLYRQIFALSIARTRSYATHTHNIF